MDKEVGEVAIEDEAFHTEHEIIICDMISC